MVELWNTVIMWLEMYFGDKKIWLLIFVCLLTILVLEITRENGKFLIQYTGIFAIIYVFPLSFYIIMTFFIEPFVYWRMFWLLPLPVLIAYAGVLLSKKIRKSGFFLITATAFCIFIVLTGTLIYGKGQYVRSGNWLKIPDKVIIACDIINEHTVPHERVQAVGDYDFMCYMRLYDASIYQPYGRYDPGYEEGITIKQEINSENPDFNLLTEKCRYTGTNFIIYATDEDDEKKLSELEFKKIGTVENYSIYKDERILQYDMDKQLR